MVTTCSPCPSFKDGPAVACPITFSSVLEAYYDCRRGKRGTANEQMYEVNGIKRVYRLYEELLDGRYKIGKSIAFIVNKPVKREVFAATFRDRIIHHWIVLRLEPLFEEYFFPSMKSNRKGKGTADAVVWADMSIWLASENYTKDCWIWKFDLKGFFMSINKQILLDRLIPFIEERYHDVDKDLLIALVEMVVMHCPQENCIRKSPMCEWDGLSSAKSMFGRDPLHGIAIGNLTSQMFANFLLYYIVSWLVENGVRYTVEFVDDFFNVVESPETFRELAPRLREHLKTLDITLHPNKCYLQHYTKGVSFIGCIIKPHRVYLSARVRRNAAKKMHWWMAQGSDAKFAEENIDRFVSVVNSYLGLAKHYQTFLFRQKIGKAILDSTWKGRGLYFEKKWTVMKVRRPRHGQPRWEFVKKKYYKTRINNYKTEIYATE